MDDWKKLDLKKVRKDFAQRLAALIGDKKNPETLETFHKKTGRPKTKLSQWRNTEHNNWPDMAAFLQMCMGAEISPTWILFGEGAQRFICPARYLKEPEHTPTEEETDAMVKDFASRSSDASVFPKNDAAPTRKTEKKVARAHKPRAAKKHQHR